MNTQEFTQTVTPITHANKNYSKVFGIGFNKTGSTTLDAIFRLYGLNMPHQHAQEIALTKQVFEGNYEPLQNFVRKFDAFQDLPFSQEHTYIIADTLFPKSKFILTERDPESWYASMCRFHGKIYGMENLTKMTEEDVKKNFQYLYEDYAYENVKLFLTEFKGDQPEYRWDKIYDKDYYIEKYIRRNEEIKKYFMGRERDFLAIDITKEKTTKQICAFLNIPEKYAIDMPHLNASK